MTRRSFYEGSCFYFGIIQFVVAVHVLASSPTPMTTDAGRQTMVSNHDTSATTEKGIPSPDGSRVIGWSDFPYSSSYPDMSSNSPSGVGSQGAAAPFDLNPYTKTAKPPTAPDGDPLRCPQGVFQTDSLCPSSVEVTWPQCSSVILSAKHIFSVSYASCLDPIDVILEASQNWTLNTSDVFDKFIISDDLITRSISVPVSTANMSEYIERQLAFSLSEVSVHRCADFFEFALTCYSTSDDTATASSVSSGNCSQEWFLGTVDQFEPVQLNGIDYIFFNGTYVTQSWWETKTMYQTSYTPLNNYSTYTKNHTIGLCGKREPFINCAGILTDSQFSITSDDNSTITVYDSFTLKEGEYTFLLDDFVGVCWTYYNLSSNEPEGNHNSNIQLIYSHVVFGISTLCLIFTLVTYCVFPELRNFQGCSILSFVASLLISQVCLQYVAPYVYGRIAFCQTVAVIAHFTFLCAFAWMTLLAVDLSRSFRAVQTRTRHDPTNRVKRFARYSLVGWGVPLLLVTVCLGLHFTDNDVVPLRYGSGRNCWLYPVLANIVFFIAPIVISLSTNIVLFVITVVNIYKTTNMTRMARRTDRSHKYASSELLIYVKILCLMGFSWVFGLVAAAARTTALWYFFMTVNALQGVTVFLSFGLNNRVRRMWRQRITGHDGALVRSGSSSGTKASNTTSSSAV